MLSWKEIVQKYIIKHSNKIKKVTQPLHDRFGVAYFTYHKIDKNGNYTVLVDRPDWAEHYVSEQFFREDPFLRHPDVYRSGFCILGTHGSKKYKESVIKDGKEIFNMDLGIVQIEKNADCVEFFGFAANTEKSSLHQVYLNQPSLLKLFAGHFKKELGSILNIMEEEGSPLIDLKGTDFLCDLPIHPDVLSDSHLAYLIDLGFESEVKKAKALSVRERECMKLLVAGKSAKETGILLDLSPRTVEFYFENIKNKLCCSAKYELFSLAKKFEELYLI